MKSIQLACIALVPALATATHAQTYKVMDYFNTKPSSPLAPGIIAQSRGGDLLTTASDQSADLLGVAFRVTTSSALTVVHQFSQATGSLPTGGLTLGRDGQFYGTTVFGGPTDGGSVFRMTPDGTVTTLHQFDRGVDSLPYAPPVQSMYGDFYGTTYGDEADPRAADTDPGTIYKIDSAGNYTLLHTFTGTDGANPGAALVQADNLWFYGTTEHAGPNNVGTIFRIDSKGDFQVLHNFNTGDGGYPGAILQANDGNFYGATYLGGLYNQGVIYRMTPDNKVTVLYAFTGGNDGSSPGAALIQGSDGYLYGTAGAGGPNLEGGTLFRISTTGSGFTVLHSFHTASGITPATLMQHTNGFFYGDTDAGGVFNGTFYPGVFFRLDMGLSPFVSYLTTYGRVGTTVQLLGDGFTASSQVSFNGVPATQISDVESSYLKVVVPPGATTGPITVTTTKGTLTSNKVFVVHP